METIIGQVLKIPTPGDFVLFTDDLLIGCKLEENINFVGGAEGTYFKCQYK
jgi:hypothetical protein